MHHFALHSHQQHVGVPALPRPRQTLVSVSLFNFSYSKRHVAVSHHSFIYFLNDWHWTAFSALVYHSHLFLCEVSGELFYSFLIVFLLSFGSSLCIPGTSSLLDTCFANIFPQSVSWLFTCLIVSFKEQKLLIFEFIKSLLIYSFMYHAFGVYLRNLCLTQNHKEFLLLSLGILSSFLHLSLWWIFT